MNAPVKPPPLPTEQLGVTEPDEIWGLQRAKKGSYGNCPMGASGGISQLAARLIQEEINKHKPS